MPASDTLRKAVWAIFAAEGGDIPTDEVVARLGCSDRVVRQYRREWQSLRLTKDQREAVLSPGVGSSDDQADFSSSIVGPIEGPTSIVATPGVAGRLHHLERAADQAAQAIARAAEITALRVGRKGATAKDVGSLRDLTALLTGALKQLKDARAEDGATVPFVDVLAADAPDVLAQMLEDALRSVAQLEVKSVPD